MLVITYKHYLEYKEWEARKIGNISCVAEDEEEYIYDTNNEHDKVFRDILSTKEEALNLINKALKPKKKIVEDIELYNNKFVTSKFKYRESDIIYKVKNKKIFFLIEHQSTIDYSIAYRMLEYSIEIMRLTIDRKENKKKSYEYPLIIPIIVYTGEKKWDAKLGMQELKEKVEWYKDKEKISLVDINEYTEEELLEEKSILSKIMLLEKSKTEEEFVENILKVLKNCDDRNLEKLKNIIKYKSIAIGKEDEIEEILNKSKIKEEEFMTLAERIKKNQSEERKRAKREGVKEGVKETKIEIATKMIKDKMDIDIISRITGLNKNIIMTLK